MKKSMIFFAAAALGILTSCDPIKDEKDFDVTHITEGSLLNGASFKQYAAETDEDGNILGYKEAADGNYISYDIPGVNAVSIFTKDEEGNETQLMNTVTGTFTHSGGGMFSLIPRRGSDPNQTVYFRYTNQDGQSVEGSTSFNVYVPSDIAYELKLIASNDYGSKVWKWDPTITGAVWGNMGYQPGSGMSIGQTGNGQWWGVTSEEEFAGQLQHSDTGALTGEESFNATMVITEDGKIKCYTADGTLVREGTFKIENFSDADPEALKWGDLITSAGSILWPFEINSGGNKPTNFEIAYLTPDKMTLVYPDGGSQGAWGEATFWHFASNSDLIGMAAGYGEGKDWTWDPGVTGAVWGNMGYLPGDGASVGTSGNGQWWGVTSTDEFNGQLAHTNTGTNIGDGDLDAYMTFGTDGKLKAYSASGAEIRNDIYEFKAVAGSDWKIADLKTTAILWPFEINSGGNIPGTYEVVYMTNDKMTLVYPDGGSQGGWGEASFWHFKAK